MHKTRWSWFLLMSLIGVTSAEGLSWSTQIIFPTLKGLFVLILYGTHYTLIVDYLARHRALTLRALVIGGFIIGITTESLITKVIWNPPWDEGDNVRYIAGLGMYEVGFIVLVWHPWISMGLSFALALTVFGGTELLTPQQIRRILRWLPILYLLGGSTQSPALIPLALIGIPLNAAGIMLAAWWYQRKVQSAPLDELAILTRRGRRIVWGIVLLLYALFIAHRHEAYPSAGPFLLGMGFIAWSFWLLRMVARADAGKTPLPPPLLPDTITYSHRAMRRYTLRLSAAALVLCGIGFVTRPASTGIAIVVSLAMIVIGDAWFVRLTWRLRREVRQMERAERHAVGKEPAIAQ